MPCTHGSAARLVAHDLSHDSHAEGDDGTEASCACRPVLVCGHCAVALIRAEGLVLMPADTVERLRDDGRPALLN